jgi:lysophospholipase L1-like esterase
MLASGSYEADSLTYFRWPRLIAPAVLVGVLVISWKEIPRWRAGGADAVSGPSVSWSPVPQGCPANLKRIAIFGDSHVAGDRAGESAVPFGKVLENELSGHVQVVLHGVGGDTAEMGERRWLGKAAGGDLVILAYGTNDAAPRGWLRGKHPVAIEAFSGSLQRQIDHWRAAGNRIALLAPPPGGSSAIMERIAPYRETTMTVGKANGVPVLDPADAFASCKTTGPLLGYDALHMTSAGHACLGAWLATKVCPSPD